LRRTRNHVLNEVSVSWRINHGVVPLVCVEFFSRARNGNTTLAFLFLATHF
jgi:hypothetical protein